MTNRGPADAAAVRRTAGGRPGTHTLLVFEKQGASDRFLARAAAKWKEALLVVAMMLVLVLLSTCMSGRTAYLGLDIAGLCRNQSTFVLAIACAAVVYVFVRNMRKSKQKWDAVRKSKRKAN